MRGAKVGLLITKGYRAVQEIQNQARDGNLFDYFYQKPVPIAPQSLTREIAERSDYLGNVLVALDREAVRRAARELEDAGVESIAVCYLFSFMNPAHEEETRKLIEAEWPDRPCLAVERSAAARAGMAAAFDHPGECVSGAGAGPLHRPSRQRPRRGGRSHAPALSDAVQRRGDAVCGGDCGRQDRAYAALGAGGRRAGRRLSGARRRQARARHARHGRHQRGYRLHRGRRAAGGHRRRHQPPPGRRAGARSDHDLGGRRFDCRSGWRRIPDRRSDQRRRRSRPGLLWARRNAADRDRRRPRLRLPQSGILPRRPAEARRRSLASGPGATHRDAAALRASRSRRRHPPHRRHPHGG